MSDNIIIRGSQQSIDNYPITKGKIYFSVDKCRMFMDLSEERIEFTDFIRGLTYAEIIRLNEPLQKVYLSKDTRQLLAYDFANEEWVAYSGGIVDPGTYVSNMTIAADGTITLIFGDGHTQVVENNLLNERLDEINETLDRYERVIEIIEQEYGLNSDDSEEEEP